MTSELRPIRIVAVSGSIRPNNYTDKALAIAAAELRAHPKVELQIVRPAVLALPFPGQPSESGDPARLRETVSNATGIILATPEYHGSFSSMIKLVIENLGFPSALAGKPVALLGVAAGQIGAIKALEALRSVCSHVGALVLPGPVSVARVREVFDQDDVVKDERIEALIRSVGKNMIDYIESNICPRMALEAIARGTAA